MSDSAPLAERTSAEWWDFKLPRSILSDYDLQVIAYGISDYLHHCVGTVSCRNNLGDKRLCVMCGNAMRLVVQKAEPMLIDAVLRRIGTTLGRPNIDLHPRVSDD